MNHTIRGGNHESGDVLLLADDWKPAAGNTLFL